MSASLTAEDFFQHWHHHSVKNTQNEEIELVSVMEPRTVEKLEERIEEAMAEIIVKMGLKKLPLLPARHTMHLMAKAACSKIVRKGIWWYWGFV